MPSLSNQLDIQRCPYCGVDRPTLTRVYQNSTRDFRGENQRMWAAYSCARCGSLVVAVAIRDNAEITGSYPSRPTVDGDLPPRAREYLQQAMDSLHAPAGAVMLAASAVDAMLKAKNYGSGSLSARIKQAATDGVITSDMADWAHHVRLDANDQRHADEAVALPSESDAQRAIDFAQALGQFMFVLPARVARGRASAPQGSET